MEGIGRCYMTSISPSRQSPAVVHFGVSYKMVHSLSEIWSAAATPPLWLPSQLTVGKKHPLVRAAQPKAKAPPVAAHSKWHRPISKMTHYPYSRQAFIQAIICVQPKQFMNELF